MPLIEWIVLGLAATGAIHGLWSGGRASKPVGAAIDGITLVKPRPPGGDDETGERTEW